MEANIEIAQLLFQQNKYQQAIDTCNEILAIDSDSIDALKLIAKSFLGTRKIDDARLYFNKALNIEPDDYEVIKDLGNTYQAIGDANTAKKYYKKAIEINNSYAPALTNLGSIEIKTGNKEKGLSLLFKATKSDPQLASAWLNLANGCVQLGKTQEAEVACRKSIALNSNLFNYHFLLGTILIEQKKLKEAVQSLRKTVELKPNFTAAHIKLGMILNDLGKLQEAEQSARKAIALNPHLFNSYFLLGTILIGQQKIQEAEQSLRKTIELKPDFTRAHHTLGIILKDLDNLKEAEIYTRKAIEIESNLAEAHLTLGIILIYSCKLEEAELSIRKAIKFKPDLAEAYWNLSLLELLQGDYKNGLEKYEFRFKTKNASITHAKPQIKKIKNKELHKEDKLLIVSEAGLGDTLLNMRYIPYLRNRDLDISFCAQTKLHSLIKASGIHPNPLTPEQANQISEGQWIPLLSLPNYLKVSEKNQISYGRYIYSTDEQITKWRKILCKERRPIIGINWQGNPDSEKNMLRGRSLKLETFSSLAKDNNYKFLSLQKGYGAEQLDHCSFRNKFVECQEQINSTWDFLENAAIIENCDLIITNDTSCAHLAGGLGKKVWLLLKDVPFWYWGITGESTFWYQSMRLFRQKERHDWDEVMIRISHAIRLEKWQ